MSPPSSSWSLQERLFDGWVRFMLRHRIPVLLAVLAITVWFSWVIAGLPIMTTLRDFLPPNGQGMAAYDAARERFGGDEIAILGLMRDDHFTEAGFERLQALTEELEDHPFVERVQSLANAQEMVADADDNLLIDDHWRPGKDLDALRRSVLADPLLANTLISADGKLAMVLIQTVANTDEVALTPGVADEIDRRLADMPGTKAWSGLPGGGRRRLEASKQEIGNEFVAAALKHGYAREDIHAVGFVVVMSNILSDARRNIRFLFPLTCLAILIALWILLRRPVDILLPMLCVGPAIIWAIGMGGLVIGRMTIITSITPVMVLVVGVSDVVHLVTQFRHDLRKGMDRDTAIRTAFRHVGAACVLTSITTLIGFGSMLLLPLPPSRELGLFAGLGVVTAFLLSFVLTPIFLSFTHPKPLPELDNSLLARALRGLAGYIRPRAPLLGTIGIVSTIIVVGLMLTVEVQNSITRKLAPEHPTRHSVQVVQKAVGSAAEIELLIDTGSPDGIHDPALLQNLANLEDALVEHPFIGDVSSLVDVLTRLRQVLAPGEAARTPLPTSRQEIAQYLLLFDMAGGEGLDTLMDDSRQHLHVIIRIGDMTAEEAIDLAEHIDALAASHLPNVHRVETNGVGLLAARLGPELLDASIQGFSTAMLLIAVLMTVLFRSPRVGLLSMVPNVFPLALAFWTVSRIFEQVDADTLTYLAVCIGIAVDDTIHFLARYRIERKKGQDKADAVAATVLEAGHGITRTSLILIAGFIVLLISDYQPIATMGALLPVTLASAVIFDLLLVPAMAQLGWMEPKL